MADVRADIEATIDAVSYTHLQAISGYLTKELQDLNVDTIRTDIPTNSTVTDVIVVTRIYKSLNNITSYLLMYSAESSKAGLEI